MPYIFHMHPLWPSWRHLTEPDHRNKEDETCEITLVDYTLFLALHYNCLDLQPLQSVVFVLTADGQLHILPV